MMEFVMECGPCDGDKSYAIDVIDTLAPLQSIRPVAMKVQFYGAVPLAARGAPRYDRTDDRPLSQFELFETQLDYDDWAEIYQYATDSSVPFFASVFSMEDARQAYRMGIRRFKIASGDITNYRLISQVVPLADHLVISTGASTEGEIQDAATWAAEGIGTKLTLLACHLAYPTDLGHAHLRRVERLQRAFPRMDIGYSDHTHGINTVAPLVTMGARMWEKHFSLRVASHDGDHAFAIRPGDLRQAIMQAEFTEDMLGSTSLHPTSQELAAREGARRSLASGPDPIREGDVLTAANTLFLRPATGISMSTAVRLFKTMVAAQDIPPYTTITPNMVR